MINMLNRKFFAKSKKDKKEIEVEPDEPPVITKNENTPSSGSSNNKPSSGSSKNASSQGNESTKPAPVQNNSDPSLLEKVPARQLPPKNPQNRKTVAVTNTELRDLMKAEFDNSKNEVDIYSLFQQSFSNRLQMDLPLNELNLASLKADVLVSMANDKADILETTLSEAEEKIEDVSSKLKVIITRSHSISEMATVINSKLVSMDEWMETLDTDTSNFRIQIAEFFVSFFSLITTIFSLMWFTFKRNTKKYITSKNH